MKSLVPPGRTAQNRLNFSKDTMISIQNLSKAFERDNLFENINLVIHPNKRIALVGKNGSGKTTLLRCLVGQEEFIGRIVSDDLKISIMEQENNFEKPKQNF